MTLCDLHLRPAPVFSPEECRRCHLSRLTRPQCMVELYNVRRCRLEFDSRVPFCVPFCAKKMRVHYFGFDAVLRVEAVTGSMR